jgi:glycogen debranching enzyme
MGYFLRAYLHFDTRVGEGKEDKDRTFHHLHGVILPARQHIQNDAWRGLPELTNKDGEECRDSCNTQAWSSSCILDFLQEVKAMT